MLCRPCFCAHRIPCESTAAYASRSGLANTYCTFPRYNCLPHATQANGNPWRRHMLKNDWAAHAKQQVWRSPLASPISVLSLNVCRGLMQTQDRAPDASSDSQHEGIGIAQQYQLPLLPITLIDQVLDCSAAQLWNIVCQPDPEFQKTIHRLAGDNDVQPGSWHQQGKELEMSECKLQLATCSCISLGSHV